MDRIMAWLAQGNAPIVVFGIITFVSLLSVLASGKASETIGMWITGVFTYWLLMPISYGLAIDVYNLDAVEVLCNVPFLAQLVDNPHAIRMLILGDIPEFLRQTLRMFILMTISRVCTIAFAGIVDWSKGVGNGIVKAVLPLVMRYIPCAIATFLYFLFALYVMPYIPGGVLDAVAYGLIVLMILTVLTPLVEYVMKVIRIRDIPVLSEVCNFISSNQVSGNLQSLFFCTFLCIITVGLVFELAL